MYYFQLLSNSLPSILKTTRKYRGKKILLFGEKFFSGNFERLRRLQNYHIIFMDSAMRRLFFYRTRIHAHIFVGILWDWSSEEDGWIGKGIYTWEGGERKLCSDLEKWLAEWSIKLIKDSSNLDSLFNISSCFIPKLIMRDHSSPMQSIKNLHRLNPKRFQSKEPPKNNWKS